MSIEKINKLKAACLSHATDLIKGSRLLLKDGLPHIAYHLAVLALEEVGKFSMILISHSTENKEKGLSLLKKAEEEHTKKIFFALWLPSFGKVKFTATQIEEFRDLANRIHFLRLKGLYVDPTNEEVAPDKAVTPEEATKMISMVETRIKMEEDTNLAEPDEDRKSNIFWFEQAVEDKEKRNLIYGRKSLDKLNALNGDAAQWIAWMRGEFEKAEKESLELTKQELARQEPPEEEKAQPKWSVRIRLYSPSHSLRQPTLTKFNDRIDKIKFIVGIKDKISELIIEKILPRGVPAQALWYAAWGDVRSFAISLNIATQGYFWWYYPKDIARFYEKIIDLDSKTEIRVERNPQLKLDWGKDVLTESNLIHAIMCYRFLPRDNVDFLNAYTAGVSLLGKNDIHTPFEKEVILQFYHALIFAMKFYGDWKDGENINNVIFEKIKEITDEKVASKASEYAEMAQSLLGGTEEKITLTECGAMKVLFDVYVLKKVIKMADDERKEDKDDDNKGGSSD